MFYFVMFYSINLFLKVQKIREPETSGSGLWNYNKDFNFHVKKGKKNRSLNID